MSFIPQTLMWGACHVSSREIAEECVSHICPTLVRQTFTTQWSLCSKYTSLWDRWL